MVEEGKLRHDVFQEKAAVELEDLIERLERYEKDMEEYHVKLANWEKRREEERRGILLKEVDIKQRSGEASGVNSRRGFIEKIMR
ncbi:hypothetical protein QJS04_geneDACA020066 [Acorus gramineus]|uniref:Uncharacterized protein n=1 Tax=Acorus gramineus TaxID=55184 RepID=A0AAV9A6P1_ACOGR|nr:hypothetical protein QJS04_geneDACA020066 [Acorus gramineus]